MRITRIFTALLSRAQPIAEKIRVAIKRTPGGSGGPQYDENGGTVYPEGSVVIFDLEHDKSSRKGNR